MMNKRNNTRRLLYRMATLLTLGMLLFSALLPASAMSIVREEEFDDVAGEYVVLFGCNFLPDGVGNWMLDYSDRVSGASSLRYTFGYAEKKDGTPVANDGFIFVSTTESCIGEVSLDLSNMKTLVFSLYLSCTPEELKALNFWTTGLEITSSGNADLEMRKWTLEQILDFYIVGEPIIGWNTVMIPLASSEDYNGRLQLSEVDFWRFYAIGGAITEQTDITIKLDRMYFTDELAPSMVQVELVESRIEKDLAEIPEFSDAHEVDAALLNEYALHYEDWKARVESIDWEMEQIPTHLQSVLRAQTLTRLNMVKRSLRKYEIFLEAQEEALKNPSGNQEEDVTLPLINGGQGGDVGNKPGTSDNKLLFDFEKNELLLLLCLEIGAAVAVVVIVSIVVHRRRKRSRSTQKNDKLSVSELANRIDISSIGR